MTGPDHTDHHPADLPELPCRDFVECVTAYLEGTLDPVDTLRLELHLRECEACLLYLGQLQATRDAVGRVAPDTLPEAARAELMRVFDAWSAGRRASP